MIFQVGYIWYGKNDTIYEGIQATINDVTSRYVQVSFSPGFRTEYNRSYGKPLGKRHFMQHFEPWHQITIFDYLDD